MRALLPILMCLACGDDPAAPATADLVFEGGTIYLDAHTTTDALAVTGGVVVATGGDALAQKGADTAVVDLDGATAWPGFHDAHVHLLAGSFVFDRLLLLGKSSIDSIGDAASDYADQHPEEPWIVGYGWLPEMIDDPRGVDLDAWVSDRPMLLVNNSGHGALVNSEAMRRAGIDATTPDPPGGEIIRDEETGEPVGLLLEAALFLVSEIALEEYDDATLGAGLVDAIEQFSNGGITGVSEVLASPGFDLARPWIYEDLEAAGELDLRVSWYVPIFEAADIADAAEYAAQDNGEGLVRFAGGKIWVDGSMGASDAWMIDPLEGTEDDRGAWYFDEAALDDLVQRAEEAGVALKMHVNGDAAIKATIDAFEAQAARGGGLQQQHVLDHVVLILPEDRVRMAELGLVASIQPAHQIGSALGDVADAWGDERFDASYDFRAFADAGIPIAMGTDWPVWPTPDAMVQVWAAASQRGALGLTTAEAMAGYTSGGATAISRGDDLGHLHPGARADITVMSDDPLAVEPSATSGLTVLSLYVDGRKVR